MVVVVGVVVEWIETVLLLNSIERSLIRRRIWVLLEVNLAMESSEVVIVALMDRIVAYYNTPLTLLDIAPDPVLVHLVIASPFEHGDFV